MMEDSHNIVNGAEMINKKREIMEQPSCSKDSLAILQTKKILIKQPSRSIENSDLPRGTTTNQPTFSMESSDLHVKNEITCGEIIRECPHSMIEKDFSQSVICHDRFPANATAEISCVKIENNNHQSEQLTYQSDETEETRKKKNLISQHGGYEICWDTFMNKTTSLTESSEIKMEEGICEYGLLHHGVPFQTVKGSDEIESNVCRSGQYDDVYQCVSNMQWAGSVDVKTENDAKKCGFVSDAFSNESPIKSGALEEDIFQCGLCLETFPSSHRLKLHIVKHTDSTQKKECNACNASCSNSGNKSCSDTGICNKSCSNSSLCNTLNDSCSNSAKHKHKHTENKDCNSQKNKSILSTYFVPRIIDENNTSDCVFTCLLCNQNLRKKSTYSHFRRHACKNDKSYTPTYFTCVVCEKAFRKKQYLSDHMVVHTGEKPYSCHICDKSFARSYSLSQHLKIHTGDYIYSCITCTVCEKTFRKLSDMKRHMKIHSGEKAYKCDFCGKMFGRPDSLQIHVRRHTGYKPYKCEECGMAFTSLCAFKSHSFIHSGEKPYHCEKCNKFFRQLSSLSYHLKSKSHKKLEL